jgi:hypothetical protein
MHVSRSHQTRPQCTVVEVRFLDFTYYGVQYVWAELALVLTQLLAVTT